MKMKIQVLWSRFMEELKRKSHFHILPFLSWDGWSLPLFCSFLSATIVLPVWKNLRLKYSYPEFVVGLISWGDESKASDFLAFYFFIGLTLLLWVALQALTFRFRVNQSAAAGCFQRMIWMTFIPLAFWLGTLLVNPDLVAFPFEWIVAAGILIIFLCRVWFAHDEIHHESLTCAGSLLFITALIGLFNGLGILVALGLIFGSTWPQEALDNFILLSVVVPLLPPFTFMAFKRDGLVNLCRFLHRYLIILQVPLPLLFLSVLPNHIIFKDEFQKYQTSFPLVFLLALLIVSAWFTLFRQGCKLWKQKWFDSSLSRSLSPLCTMGIPIFIAVRVLSYPTFFSDDFHLGEQLLPWQQLITFQKIPFVDFAPIHGVMPLLTGLFNWFFYDGTLANYVNAIKIFQAIGVGATFLSIYFLASPSLALFCSFLLPSQFFLVGFDRLLFIAPAIFILANQKLFANRQNWLLSALLISTFMVLYNPSTGIAFLISIVAFLLWQGFQHFHSNKRAFIFIFAGTAIAGSLLMAFPYSRDVLWGYFYFIAENGSTNNVAHGIPAVTSIRKTNLVGSFLSNYLVFETFRFLWIFFIPLAILIALCSLCTNKKDPKGSRLFLLISPAILLTVLSVWSLGRIDPGASRTGLVSFIVVGQILPVVIFCTYKNVKAPVFAAMALLGAIFCALFGFQDHFNAKLLAQRALGAAVVPESMTKIEGSAEGMPNLGTIFTDSARLNQITEFRHALSEIITEEQTYFDLTNQQAYYFFLNKPVPALYSATFNVVNRDQQLRILQQFSVTSPPAVLIQPSMNFDGFSSSLRSFYLYRELIQKYNPVKIGNYTFLVNETSKAYPLAAVGIEKQKMLSEIFSHFDLKAIPSSWGRSWSSLQHKAKRVKELDPLSFSEINGTGTEGILSSVALESHFDEVFYLRTYPDVAAAVQSGRISSGHVHYQRFGKAEGRMPSANTGPSLIEYDLQPLDLGGTDVDLVVIGLKGSDSARLPKEIAFRWIAEGGESTKPIRVLIGGEYLVIPVSSFPDWLLTNKISKIQILAQGSFASLIREISFWQRDIHL